MKRMTRSLVVVAVVLATASGCAQSRSGAAGPSIAETTAGVVGAVLGGLLGAQFGGGAAQVAFASAGTALGGLAGSELGAMIAGGFGSDDDEGEAQAWVEEEEGSWAAETPARAGEAPVGGVVAWKDPDSGAWGSVTPTRESTSESGENCREFSQTVNFNGRTETTYGVACRNEDGVWRMVK